MCVTEHVLAIHGLPTHPGLWAHVALPMQRAPLRGLVSGTGALPDPLCLDAWLDDLRAQVTPDTVLLGHDLGGVIAALLAAERPVRSLVLSGTSLDPWYWALVRASAVPGARRYFYDRYAGRRFLTGGMSVGLQRAALATFLADAPPDYADRMCRVAAAMRIGPGLIRRLVDKCVDVSLIWGRFDPWYPVAVAARLSMRLSARLEVVDAGHLAPWEQPSAYTRALTRCLERRRALGDGPARG
jgi:pimeloyl-ACP methyl ester carboxylesterase